MTEPLAVLFVEDDADDADLLDRELRKGGYAVAAARVQTAADLRAALAARPWQLVLSDYSMPAFDGMAALRVVREVAPGVPFILISGTVGEEVAVESIKAGADDYLMKHNLIRLVPAVARALHDAAERRRLAESERELRESRELTALVYNNVSDYLVLLARGPDGVFRYAGVNETYRKKLAAAGFVVAVEADMLGKTPEAVEVEVFGLPPAAVETAAAARRRAVATRRPVEFERTLHLPGGEFVIESTVVPVAGPGGTITHLLSAGRDVTARKRAADRERHLQDQLTQSQKLEALGTLVGGVAHDFNNLLACIIGYTEMAGRAGDLTTAREYLDEVLIAGNRATELVRQVLTFGRRQTPARVARPLGAVVSEVARLMRASIPAAVATRVVLPDPDVNVLADAGQVHQVLMNLCTNAVHAMPAGGTLTVTLAREELDAAAAAPLRPGGYAVLTVADTGTGMDAETLRRVFEPFFTTKPVGTGTGLGMAVVHGIVRDHDGGVTITSTPGQGTAVRVLIPAVDTADLPAPAAPRPAGAGERVLCVDDDPAAARVTAGILQSLGYRAECETDPARAAETFAADPHGFAAVVTDLVMPGLTGRELIQRVRAARPDVPVLVVAAFGGAGAADDLRGLGCGVLAKPFRVPEIAAALRAVLGG